MKLFHTDLFVLPLPEGHRFPMQRYRLLRERLEDSGLFAAEQMCMPPAATDEQLRLVHTADWVERVATGGLTEVEQRRIGFPWSLEMAERSRRSAGATIAAASCALTDGVAANLAGGTHHAFADRGAGYCVFNDVAVAIRCLQSERRIERALVIDLDVHQGDGTAAIFADDTSVTTFSLHAKKAFPARKQRSDLDIELPIGTNDEDYLAAVKAGLDWAAGQPTPDLVCYLAGADPFEKDTLGGLAVTKGGLLERDRMVMGFCGDSHLPLVITLAGGYAEDISDIVDIQFHTIVLARQMLSQCSPTKDNSIGK
ncbi:histone deacetylase family protein [Fuerstiella marisgermanici]|uniref:Acetoin utilization protein AcuC n=1 Tax=Fuerstiella marisgermanici TaxID=1891926 RepID=A0A1P8WGN1_9PLAN|nr:histone deacetylase [Fuerstiella marisgermanici]APZ93190.1 Acetoin utilization protein AcuC [Fuerstiella marisgermanici]